ncbi:MAG: hypothetical protein COB61_004085 [Thiotrichales bacterium]|nr:hypothetical protein [Thiotrichales bacterium]
MKYDAEDVLQQWACHQRSIKLPNMGYPSAVSCFAAIKATSPDYSDMPDEFLALWDPDNYPEQFMMQVEIWICELDEKKVRAAQMLFVCCNTERAAASKLDVGKSTIQRWRAVLVGHVQFRLDNEAWRRDLHAG